jgi:fumarate reductase subunit D
MKVSSQERAFGALGYLFLLFIIPLFAKRDSLFVQFHARQGMVLFLLWSALSLLVLIVLAIASGVFIVETIFIALWLLATFLYALLAIIALFKVALGERYRMPVVADVALAMRL